MFDMHLFYDIDKKYHESKTKLDDFKYLMEITVSIDEEKRIQITQKFEFLKNETQNLLKKRNDILAEFPDFIIND